MINLEWRKIENPDLYNNILSSYTGTMGFDADSGTMAEVKTDVNAYVSEFLFSFENLSLNCLKVSGI